MGVEKSTGSSSTHLAWQDFIMACLRVQRGASINSDPWTTGWRKAPFTKTKKAGGEAFCDRDQELSLVISLRHL